jgi:hypothetical protein
MHLCRHHVIDTPNFPLTSTLRVLRETIREENGMRKHGSLEKDDETNQAAWEAAKGAAWGGSKVRTWNLSNIPRDAHWSRDLGLKEMELRGQGRWACRVATDVLVMMECGWSNPSVSRLRREHGNARTKKQITGWSILTDVWYGSGAPSSPSLAAPHTLSRPCIAVSPCSSKRTFPPSPISPSRIFLPS